MPTLILILFALFPATAYAGDASADPNARESRNFNESVLRHFRDTVEGLVDSLSPEPAAGVSAAAGRDLSFYAKFGKLSWQSDLGEPDRSLTDQPPAPQTADGKGRALVGISVRF